MAKTDRIVANGGVITNGDGSLFPDIFKFLYKNEQLCGDVFAEPQWLPAQSDCEILCPVTKGLCLIFVNLSANGARVQKQKCRQFPMNCTSELQRLMATSLFASTSSATAITNITLMNATGIPDTVTRNNDTTKYHEGLIEVRNEQIYPNSGSNGIIDPINQPTSGIHISHSGKRKETQFKRKFHGKIELIEKQKSYIRKD
uniref:Uncharacterized protein n=1 Tax=Setaria digitata TaxID=48799 RepID=A0A915PI28_9BILA